MVAADQHHDRDDGDQGAQATEAGPGVDEPAGGGDADDQHHQDADHGRRRAPGPPVDQALRLGLGLAVLGDEQPAQGVEQEAGAAEDGEDDEQDAEDQRVDAGPLAEAAGDAEGLPVAAAAAQGGQRRVAAALLPGGGGGDVSVDMTPSWARPARLGIRRGPERTLVGP